MKRFWSLTLGGVLLLTSFLPANQALAESKARHANKPYPGQRAQR